MKIGKAIRKTRRAKDISQKELAEQSNVSQTYLSQIENDRKQPTISKLKDIADKLDVPLHEIVKMAEDVL